MNLVWGILGIIIIVYIRIWIINNAFKKRKFKWNITIHVLILSLILVCFLYFYKDILTALGLQNLYLLEDNTRKTIGVFVVYCLSFIVLLTTSFGNITKGRSLRFIFISLLLFLGIGVGGSIVGINILVMYYLVSSYAEEILKFSVGQNIFLENKDIHEHKEKNKKLENKNKLNKSDLIFFAIIAGLGFSVIENLFYLIAHYFDGDGGLVLSVGRSVFSTLLHVVATGIIAFFVIKKGNTNKLKGNNIKNIVGILMGILAGFILHGLYNLSLHYNIIIATILILIVCYFILSFLLFKSDLVYQKK